MGVKVDWMYKDRNISKRDWEYIENKQGENIQVGLRVDLCTLSYSHIIGYVYLAKKGLKMNTAK